MILWAFMFIVPFSSFQEVYSDTKFVAVYNQIIECEDPGERAIDFSKVTVIQESASETYITGDVIFHENIDRGTQVKADINHEVDGNEEYVCGIVSDICSEMNNTETPWYPIMKGMGITDCPIKKGTYHMDQVTLDISEFDEYMKTEYCGDYGAIISFLFVPEENDVLGGPALPKVYSCHEFGASIFEVSDE